jgi:hypothetical protein
MNERSNNLCFSLEIPYILVCQLCMQDFDCNLCIESQVLSKIDFCEATAPQELHEAVIAQLLAHTFHTFRHKLSLRLVVHHNDIFSSSHMHYFCAKASHPVAELSSSSPEATVVLLDFTNL